MGRAYPFKDSSVLRILDAIGDLRVDGNMIIQHVILGLEADATIGRTGEIDEHVRSRTFRHGT